MAGAEIICSILPPHSGHFLSMGSENNWIFSKRCPHFLHSYSYKGITLIVGVRGNSVNSGFREPLGKLARMQGDAKTGKGTLFVVATPIGNLEDITLRALRVLKEADLIACEDTRQSQKLLSHFGVERPTVSYHEHNEAERAAELVARLEQGASIALVSDAGMPGISDPGYRVVALAVERGIVVVPIPGAVAFASALAASGLATDAFRFNGFLPAKSGQRKETLEGILSSSLTEIFYEAPHRLIETLREVVATLGPERPMVVAREPTKVHDEFVCGS